MTKVPGRILLGLAALAVVLLAGCSAAPQPDLDRIYSEFADPSRTRPIVVIPGIMGSTLVDRKTGEEIWPGGLLNLVTGSTFDRLRLPVAHRELEANTDTLQPGKLFGEVAGRNYYARIVRTLSETGGYDCVLPGKISRSTNCVLFPWDWRRDMTESAVQLDKLIQTLRRRRGDSDLKVNVVAHSAGGLLTRYYVRYGKRDVLDNALTDPQVSFAGARKIEKIALVATPNFGSIPALQRAVMGQEVGFTSIPPETLATMPGLYQTLPHPSRTFMIDVNGDKIDRDLYDVETWEDYEWSIFDPEVRARIRSRFDSPRRANRHLENFREYMTESLTRARRFHQALSVSRDETPVRYIVFGSSCILTPSTCLVERVDGERRIRLYPEDVVNRHPGVNYRRLMMAPGDGTVTKASLLARENLAALAERSTGDFPIDYSVFICEHHATYPSNITFQDNLLNILLY